MARTFFFIGVLYCALLAPACAQTGSQISGRTKPHSTTIQTKASAGHTTGGTAPGLNVPVKKLPIEDPALTAAKQQAKAADQQVTAAWVTVIAQVILAGITIRISCLLLKLSNQQVTEMTAQLGELREQRNEMGLAREEARLQRVEMQKDRAETEKARKLSLMPVLECNIVDNYSESATDLEQTGSAFYLRHSTVQLHNTGNAAALQTRVTIKQEDNPGLQNSGPIISEWHTIAPTGSPEHDVRILPAYLECLKLPGQTFDFLVTIEYVNAYNKLFTTKTQFHVKPYAGFLRPGNDKIDIVISQWKKSHEEFDIIDW